MRAGQKQKQAREKEKLDLFTSLLTLNSEDHIKIVDFSCPHFHK